MCSLPPLPRNGGEGRAEGDPSLKAWVWIRDHSSLGVYGIALAVWYAPWSPQIPSALLDSGWKLGLCVGLDRGMAFGRDLVFTYGPYSCLTTRQYWPPLYLASLAFEGALALLCAGLTLQAARAVTERYVGLCALFVLGITTDTLAMALPIVFVWHALRSPKRGAATWLAILAMGPLALAKFVLLPLCLAAVICAALLRGRIRFLWLDILVLAAAVIGAWLLAGQPLAGIADYLRNAWEVASGYPQAMQWPGAGSAASSVATLAQLAVAALALALGILVLWQPRAAGTGMLAHLAWLGFVGFVLLLSVRLGATRGEYLHLGIATAAIAALAALSLAWASRRRVFLAAVLAVSLVATFAFQVVRYQGKGGGLLAERLDSTVPGLIDIVSGHDPRRRLDERLALARREIERDAALDSLVQGSYDVLGQDQFLILALGEENWLPRPVLQGYSAYTPALAQLNARHLAGAAAPRFLVAPLQTIDGRFPMMDDAAIWPQVAARYEVMGRAGKRLVLQRRPEGSTPATSHNGRSWKIRVNDWTALTNPDGPVSVYGTLTIASSPLDGLRSMLWKPPLRYLELRTAGSEGVQRFRIIDKAAAGTFLLSPAITDVDGLEAWLRGNPRASDVPTALRVVDESGSPLEADLTLRATPFGETESR
jgi:hypothetical protein